MLNTTETSFDDKKVTCEKNNCLIHTISLVILCSLLLVAITLLLLYKRLDKKGIRIIVSNMKLIV